MRCAKCRTEHKASIKKFPVKLTKKGEKDKLVGYLCLKCSRKALVAKRDKKVGWKQAFRDLVTVKQKENNAK